MSDYLKSFQRTKKDAESQIRNYRLNRDKEECSGQIFNSTTHLEISLEKLFESIGAEAVTANKEHIDNIFYHLGAIKGSIN